MNKEEKGMSTMNAIRSRFGSVAAFLAPYKNTISLVFYVVISLMVLYTVYGVLYPGQDKFEQVVINKSKPASELKAFQQQLYPPMTTGGEYSFQTWLYINNLDYKPGVPKHVFTIASDGSSGSTPPHVTMIGMLDPTENKLIIRIHQDTMGAAGAGQGPDYTLNTNITNLFSGALKPETSDSTICDIANMELQRWVCLAVVVNGRMVDVYIDGKMARSCVCPGVPVIDPGNNFLTMGLLGGFGGSVSTTRFFGYALTPARVYEIYQAGPATPPGFDRSYGFLGTLLNTFGLTFNTTPALSIAPALNK
jgi:Concanavalin A-like lectin/glucanases superfamily